MVMIPRHHSAFYLAHSFGDGSHLTVGVSYNHEPAVLFKRTAVRHVYLSATSLIQTSLHQTRMRTSCIQGSIYPKTSYGGAFVIDNTRYTIGANGQLRPMQNGATPYGPLGYLVSVAEMVLMETTSTRFGLSQRYFPR